MNDYSELKKAAEACGPLPWRFIERGITSAGVRDDHGFIAFMDYSHPAKYGACPDREAKARFIGHATPATVLALIAENEKIDADRKACWAEFKVQGSYIRELQAENNELIADGESNSSQLSDVLAERDRLQLVLFDRNAEIEALRKECARLAEDNRSMLEHPEDLL